MKIEDQARDLDEVALGLIGHILNKHTTNILVEFKAALATERARADAAVGDANDAERRAAELEGLLRKCRIYLGGLIGIEIDAALAGQPQHGTPEWPKEQCPVTGAIRDVDPADLAEQPAAVDERGKWDYCPECGSEAVGHEEGNHKQCADCRQEWWADIDYSDVVRKHLGNNYSNWQTVVENKDAQITDLKRAALVPAAVVMPERMTTIPEGKTISYAAGYEAALDAVANLNRNTVPLELLQRITDTDPIKSRGILAAVEELRAILGAKP